MSRIELLVAQLDEAYGRLHRRLDGLSDEEYLWQPVPGGWSIRPGADGRWAADYAFPDPQPAPFTTVAWRLLHIADCKVMYHEYAYGAGVLTFPDLVAPRTASAALARLAEGHELLRADLTGLADDSALDAAVPTNWGGTASDQAEPDDAHGGGKASDQAEPDHARGGGGTMPAWRVFWTMIEHDAWHGGEIGALRDLYRRRSSILPRGIARP